MNRPIYEDGNSLLWAAVLDTRTTKYIQFLLKAGIFINTHPTFNNVASNNNALTSHLMSRPVLQSISTLLFAAGEKTDGAIFDIGGSDITDQLHVPYYLRKLTEPIMCLKHQCRAAIRKHLINLNPNLHLFHGIPKLGLPSVLTEYLLFDMSLDTSPRDLRRRYSSEDEAVAGETSESDSSEESSENEEDDN